MADLQDFAEARERAERTIRAYRGAPFSSCGVPDNLALARDLVALHAALETATAERDELRELREDWRAHVAAHVAANDRLEGQLTALREALEWIASHDYVYAKLKAREALAGLPEADQDRATGQREARDAIQRALELRDDAFRATPVCDETRDAHFALEQLRQVLRGALAGLEEPPQEARPGVVTDGFVTAMNAADVVVPTHVDTAAGTVTDPGVARPSQTDGTRGEGRL